MDKNISSRVLRLVGAVELPEDLEASVSYKIRLDGEVRSVEDKTDDEGGFIRTFRFSPIIGEVIAENGKITKTKDARSRSKQLRATIRRQWLDENSPLSEEEYYDKTMAGIIMGIIEGKK